MNKPPSLIPDLHRLVTLFSPSLESVGAFTEVTADDLPPPYRRLLDHHDHMTLVQEAVHGCRVAVEVRKRRFSARHYERQSWLRSTQGGEVVQYCVVRLEYAHLDETVREEVENESTPLGRILIQHEILRRLELVALWRVTAGVELCQAFGLHEPALTFGRTALIYCHGDPAVELLEIVAPLRNQPG